MPTISQQPIDVQWAVALASGTTYVGFNVALAAAGALSAGNANAPVQIAVVEQQATSATALAPSQVNMLGGNPTPLYIVQLQATTTYYPLATALTQAYTLSAANSNAPVNIARVIEVVTAP